MTNKKKIAKYKEAFGDFIGNKRISSGWTQEELSVKLGNNRQNISAMERGQHNPSLIKIKDIADAFEITPGELFKEFDDWLGLWKFRAIYYVAYFFGVSSDSDLPIGV